MASSNVFKSLCILPLLFATNFAWIFGPNDFMYFTNKKILGPYELFGNPIGNPQDYKSVTIPDDFGTIPIENPQLDDPDVEVGSEKVKKDKKKKKKYDVQTGFGGQWELASANSGVSAMHSILLPKVNKVLMYDATIWRISNIPLANGQCHVYNQTTGEKDCWAHSVLYDIETSELKPLELGTDTWCSSGGLSVDGNLISTGGFRGGANTVRYLDTCEECTWREYPAALASGRWYSTQATLPDGGFIVVGGRDAHSYEYIPPEGQSNPTPYNFPFLQETMDREENNLYPFVHLSTDGNVFIFANNRSVLLNPVNNQIVREFPILPGGSRNYPASGMSVLLPIKLHKEDTEVITAEVFICSGSAHKDTYSKADRGIFYTALKDCARIKITDKKPVWKREYMPSPRIMGDMMILPTGDILMLNGAKRGSSGWGFAREPNFTPVLYNPKAKKGKRFRELTANNIPRMYHSSSTVLPDGKVLVAGSNTNNGYIYKAMFPTELQVEKFSPPYLDPVLAPNRPTIVPIYGVPEQIGYGQQFAVKFQTMQTDVVQEDLMVTMYAPAFTTHGVSMNQRLINLGLDGISSTFVAGVYSINVLAPSNAAVAPPGYYMLFVVYKGVPSVAVWIQIK